jgi:hypothetical protein
LTPAFFFQSPPFERWNYKWRVAHRAKRVPRVRWRRTTAIRDVAKWLALVADSNP